MMTGVSCLGTGQGITTAGPPLWIGSVVSQFCSSITKRRSRSVTVNVGSSQESSLQVNTELSPFSDILTTVLVSQITVPLSTVGGRVCH